jgi:phospholipid/cholesterol/gamma-HCH transport system substrate-binding protein/paraquat-inducible protein B
MKSRSFPFVVGLFVLASFALIFGLTLFLGASNYLKPKFYAETLITQSVSGLTKGSPVKLRGVPCGEVKKITFLRNGATIEGKQFDAPVRVLMELERDMFIASDQDDFNERVKAGVKTGLRARPTQAGLTGGLDIELTVLDPAQFPAADEPPDGLTDGYAYIPSVPGLLTEFVDRLSAITDKLAKVDFDAIGANLNTLLANGDTMVKEKFIPAIDEIRATVADLRKILEDQRIEQIVGNVDNATKSIAEIVGGEQEVSLKAFIAQLPEIGARLRSAIDRIDEIMSNPKIPQLIDDLGPTVTALHRTIDRIDRLVASEQYDIRELIAGLRSLVANLDDLSASLKADPARLIFGKPVPPVDPQAPDANFGDKK